MIIHKILVTTGQRKVKYILLNNWRITLLNTSSYSSLTVVFEQELKFLRAQAYSMDRYWHCTGDIIVVVNDDKNIIDQIDASWWERHQHCVKIIHYSLWYEQVNLSGWVTQQICK